MSSAPVGSSANITLGLADERAGDGDALLLAARELGRPVAAALVEADALERRRGRPTRRSRLPASRAGSATFCSAVSAPSRLKDWKTKPIRSRRRRASASLAEPVELVLAEAHAALRRPVQARGELQQRRLARSPTAP